MRRALITGGAGAIGIHVVDYILEKTNWEIVVVDSFRHKGYFDRFSLLEERNRDLGRISVFTHDLTAPFTSREISKIGPIDYVINLAARSDVQASIEDPVSFIKNNTDLMLNVLEYAKEVKPKAFIQFSTDEVYGPAPIDGGHKEWEPILPSNPYSASKACQEALAIAWWRCYDIPLIITNTMNNFGETQAPSKFPAMIQKNLQEGKTINVHIAASGEIGTRYYIHSRNVADALLFILTNVPAYSHSYGEIDSPVRLNIVGDKQVSNLDLVNIIADLMGKTPKIELVNYHENNPGHDIHYGLDGSKLASLGWHSPVSFEDSLRATIKWQQAHPEWLL